MSENKNHYIKNLEAAVLIHERLLRKIQTCAVAIPGECQQEYSNSLAIFGRVSAASKLFAELPPQAVKVKLP